MRTPDKGKDRITAYSIEVSGRVQGVGFRYSAVKMANHLGIKGYVKNLYNGNVLLEIEGDSTAVDKMITWCREGPSMSVVRDVSLAGIPVRGYRTFEVRG